MHIACENIRFSSLLASGDVSRGGTSATQRQKFNTDDANQCLHTIVPDINLSNSVCLLIDFGKVLCSSANELQQNSNAKQNSNQSKTKSKLKAKLKSREDYIPQILTVSLEILRVYV